MPPKKSAVLTGRPSVSASPRDDKLGNRPSEKRTKRADRRRDIEKQAAFVRFYNLDRTNAQAAAIKAGYAPGSAKVSASRLLRQPHIIAQLDKMEQRQAKRIQITLDEIVDELAHIARANITDFVEFNSEGEPVINLAKASREQLAAIGEVSVEDFVDGRGEDARDVRRVRFKLLDKKGALVDLGKHLGGFVNRNTHGGGANGDEPIPVKVEHVVRFVKRDGK